LNCEVLHQYWPPETQILLLIAALGEREAAANAWRTWTQRRDIEKASWPEVRLLAAVARRMAEIDPESKLTPRLQGIRRFVWTQTQMCLGKTLELAKALNKAQLRFMLLKGAARIAADPAASAERLIRDLDLLIYPDDWTSAVDAAMREGWQIDNENPAAARAKSYAEHHAVCFIKADAQVDLHRHALYICRNNGDDERFWQRKAPVQWRGIETYIPSATDELLIALNHGFMFSPEPIADWALDAAALIRSGKVDWKVLAEETARRELDVQVAAGLNLLIERIGLDVPPEVITSLHQRLHEPFISEFVSNATAYEPQRSDLIRSVLSAAGIRAQKAVGYAGDNSIDADGTEKKITDPIRIPVNRRKRAVRAPESLSASGKLRIELDFTLWPLALGRRVIVEIRAPGLLLKREIYPLWKLGKFLPIRKRITVGAPAALFVARNIDHITVRLARPRWATPTPVRSCVVRWKLSAAAARSAPRI
jgi:Uncharacterised nucleotidyltransferase